ncbi:MAG: hypothetical protein ABFS17_09290 [Chloroflexota bacterium]
MWSSKSINPHRLVGAVREPPYGVKIFTTKQINHLRGTPGTRFWQRSFYNHIIREEDDLDHVRSYIRDNDLKREHDLENPINS